MINDLPEMYRHCKAEEDRDMTPFDFITDHLVNIDGVFDKHNNGDEQKPHDQNQGQHRGQMPVYLISYFSFSTAQLHPIEVKPSILSVSFLQSEYISKFFHPPIV